MTSVFPLQEPSGDTMLAARRRDQEARARLALEDDEPLPLARSLAERDDLAPIPEDRLLFAISLAETKLTSRKRRKLVAA